MLYLAVGHILGALAVASLARRWRLRADGLALVAYGCARLVFDSWRDYDPAWLLLSSRAISATLMAVGLLVLVKGPREQP